jgi:hypothetical protein
MSGNLILYKIQILPLKFIIKLYLDHKIPICKDKSMIFRKFMDILKHFRSQPEMSGIFLKNVRGPRSV